MRSKLAARSPGRITRAVAVAGAAAVLVTACGDDGTGDAGGGNPDTGDSCDNTPAEGDVSLTFSWWGSDDRHAATQEIIDAFMAENPTITIEPSFIDWDGYWDKLATETAGDNAPDIMTQEERYMTDYANRGRLLDLNAVEGTLDLGSIDQMALGGGELDGGLYGVATGVNTFSIVADPQAFADAGVELPDDTTWTWQDYIDISNEISANSDYYGSQAFGDNEAGFKAFARQRGEELYNPDGTLGFSAQTLADWWQLSVDLIEGGGAPEASETEEIRAAGVEQSLLATNEGAMGWWWSNQLGVLTETSGRDLVLLRQPGETEGARTGTYLKPAMYYSIASDTEYCYEAALFVDFMLNSPQAIEIMQVDRGVPANTQLREEIKPDLEAADAAAADFIAEVTPTIVDAPPAPPNGAGETVDITTRLFQEVIFGNLEPMEAAEQFISEVEMATQ